MKKRQQRTKRKIAQQNRKRNHSIRAKNGSGVVFLHIRAFRAFAFQAIRNWKYGVNCGRIRYSEKVVNEIIAARRQDYGQDYFYRGTEL